MTVIEFLAARLDEREGAVADVKLVTRRSIRDAREVVADRAFLALVERYLAEDPGLAPWDSETQDLMDAAIRARCAVYSDHPDYDPGWGAR